MAWRCLMIIEKQTRVHFVPYFFNFTYYMNHLDLYEDCIVGSTSMKWNVFFVMALLFQEAVTANMSSRRIRNLSFKKQLNWALEIVWTQVRSRWNQWKIRDQRTMFLEQFRFEIISYFYRRASYIFITKPPYYIDHLTTLFVKSYIQAI